MQKWQQVLEIEEDIRKRISAIRFIRVFSEVEPTSSLR
jgi:hypothetical protein